MPDELLIARDNGRVVFFCGAGVSRAKAGLPDFFGLAEKVIRQLKISADNPALRLFNEAREIEKRSEGIAGLITADRLFGLLERDFHVHDIESAVASALKPDNEPNLTAHRMLIDLATTREGIVRLVTTNFDRFFDDCRPGLPSWQHPRLPDPSRPTELDGIIYLHGKASSDYSGAEGDGFILSSSDFGRAYLSEGWATSFFREIISRYVVVFVGYTADDPPVNYLLEAFNKANGKFENVYAFQSGNSENAVARWVHKGVTAIPYGEQDDHVALWSTLEAWAHRARDPHRWYSSVIDQAKEGPEKLFPHERGQIAHIVSTVEGLRRFSESDESPPAEWLCVFDPQMRYAKPRHSGKFLDEGPYIDPFDLYCIDSDAPPGKIDPTDSFARREIPTNAWDAFALNSFDRGAFGEDNFSSLRGHRASNIPHLPSRLDQMGIWINKVAAQPATVWWAAHQYALHPSIRNRIQIQWEREYSYSFAPEVRKAWHYLFEHWERESAVSRPDWHRLHVEVQKDGWNAITLRKYAAYCRPFVKVEPGYRGPKPLGKTEEIELSNLIKLDVVYPNVTEDIEIPAESVVLVVAELRKSLEIALQLEEELGRYGLRSISPIIPDDDPDQDHFERTHGLSGAVIRFSRFFERLRQIDREAAKQELSQWPIHDDKIFARLRIWAAGKFDLVPDDQFGAIFAKLSDETFWDMHSSRDLLLTLSSRWNTLSNDIRIEIANRLLEGPPRRKNEKNEESFNERRAWSTLNRMTWLSRRGCEFHFDITAETERLRAFAPTWQPGYADQAAESWASRADWITTETEHSILLMEPLASTLSKALELSGRKDNSFVEHDPYAGLSVTRPVRAFAALRMAAKGNSFPEWAWSTFLRSEAKRSNDPRFVAFISEQLMRYPDEALGTLIHPIADWFFKASGVLAVNCPASFDRTVNKLIQILTSEPANGASTIIWGYKDIDWATDALNAATGSIARSLFNDPRIANLTTESFPPTWWGHVNSLLSLPSTLRRHALVIFTYNLNWFYSMDPEWSDKNLLSVLDSDDLEGKEAFWDGFFWSAQPLSPMLYLRLKSYLLQLPKEIRLRCRYGQKLSSVLLSGWGSRIEGTDQRFITEEELRETLLHTDDDFRSKTLWNAGRWLSGTKNRDQNRWASLLLELFGNVWPRQKSVKTPEMSRALFDFVFSCKADFLALAEVILPLLTKIDGIHWMLPFLDQSKDNIVDVYPSQTLALLHVVLSDRVSAWPYGIDDWLARIREADGALNTDERLLELKRKWDSR